MFKPPLPIQEGMIGHRRLIHAWSDIVYGCQIYDPYDDSADTSSDDREDEFEEQREALQKREDEGGIDEAEPEPVQLQKNQDEEFEQEIAQKRGYPWTTAGIEDYLTEKKIEGFHVVKRNPAETAAPVEEIDREYYLTFDLPSSTKRLVAFFSTERDFDEEFANALDALGIEPGKPTLFSIASANQDD